MPRPSPRLIALAAGGTGGHLYPAEALAEELLQRGHRVMILTDRRGRAFGRLTGDVTMACVPAATFKTGWGQRLFAVLSILAGTAKALFLLWRARPAVVVGFGGYPSFPGMAAAQLLGLPTLLHEQNAVLGKANRVLARRARRIALSAPDTQGLTPQNAAKATVTGNPVRGAFVAARAGGYAPPTDTFRLLITGGSQGARVLADVVPAALAALPPELRGQLSVAHQCRNEDVAKAQACYAAAGISAAVEPFFDDLAARLAACHLLIGRSGASTVAEVAAVGRPAIFTPLQHADRQQFLNAETLARTGAAWVLTPEDFTAARLAEQVAQLAKTPAMLENAAAAAKACGRPDAVRALAACVEHLA